MAAANLHKLAVIIKNPLDKEEFLLIKQTRPPKFNDPEYDSFVDSDLWDLPSVELTRVADDHDHQLINSQIPIKTHEFSSSEMIDFSNFDLNSALNQALELVGFETAKEVDWELLKSVEEPDFGPGLPIKTVYIVGDLGSQDGKLKEVCKWIRMENCLDMLLEVKPGGDRVGPSVVLGLLNDITTCESWKIPPTSHCQEYPPGLKLVPMGSRTGKPFRTTNLIVIVSGSKSDCSGDDSFVAQGDALIVDPGCSSAYYKELEEIVAALPKKLVVFVTHHHRDHVDGLSVVQKCNTDATLLAHEKTLQRIRKDDWSFSNVAVSGSEEIYIGGQRLRIIYAPGHTDGHMALLHVSTNSLIVGDHCVGQGSAILDVTSGGNMTEYFRTTYLFMDLSPHNIIPLHGRTNLWPKHMLSGYLKNRRNREATILKAIEDGAKTLFDIVSYTYAEVDRSFWIAAASNVKLHVEHLAEQDKLPKEFSIQKFQSSCLLHFLSRWIWAYSSTRSFPLRHYLVRIANLVGAAAVVSFAAMYLAWRKLTQE